MDNDIIKSHKSTNTTGKNTENKLLLRKFETEKIIQDSKMVFENKIERKWLTSKEVASYLAISENALRIMVHRNQIPSYKFGRRLRFLLSECVDLIQKRGI